MKRARNACAALLLSASGCTVFGNSALQKDPNFREGYQDGCAAATNQGSDLRDRPVGDKQLYANDETYRQGWSSGFQTCRRSDLEPNAAPGDNPVTVPGPGH
ncbi:MAG TPA: hypothetical protein VHT03_00270 [Rhizomicrobium sp.]|jgi:hypothetical protein|nr:hypothetical protein [Rhizomicrobium sp.]